jgi:dCMP deaminase
MDDAFVEWCKKCFLFSTDLRRPDFNEYFLMIAFVVSLRSEDKFIRHGAVIVNKASNHIIGTGYNATLRGSDKKLINLDDRDSRRLWMIHAEDNAIMNCTKNPLDLYQGASIYVTGVPCITCLQKVINFGIREIYFADRLGTITEDKNTLDMREKIIRMSNVKYVKIPL